MQNNANEMAVFNTAIYVRLSKEDIVAAQSGRESNSITNQKQLILDFLKDKPEFNIVSIRIDDGYTGTNFDRPAFQRMLNDIKAGRINCVVVKDLSRFGREYINSGKYIHRLFPVLGVRLIAINDNIDTITRDESSEFTLHFIAKTLNEQGVPSPGRYLYDIGLRKTEKFKNAIWYLQTIKKILVDPVYLGWIVSGKYRSQLCERGTKTTVKTPEEEWIINKGMHEPIVSKELFDKVQDILSARQSEQGLATIYDSKSKRRSMFKGILRCGECGRSMYLRSKSNRGYYYYCTLHENYNATICPKKAVKQEDVESLALRLIQTQIRAFSDAQGLIANLNATPSSQTRYQIYETQIDDAKRKIEKFNQLKAALYGDFADGLLSHQDYTDLSEDYSRRADDLRIFIAELEKEKEKYSVGFGSKMQWALLIEKYKDQESLDAEMAAAFIETLTLFNDGHVEVAFRHRDEIEQVLYVAATRGKEAERYAG